MIQLTFFYTVAEKPEWLTMDLTFYVSGFDGTEIKALRDPVYRVARALASVMKVGTNFTCAVVQTVAQAAFGGAGTDAFVFALTGDSCKGQRPLDGDMYYRQVLRFRAVPPVGRCGNHWFRGCLDTGDLIEKDGQPVALKDGPLLAQTLQDQIWANQAFMLYSLGVVPQAGGVPSVVEPAGIAHIGSAHYTDSHQQTRWRRRTQGALVNAFAVLIQNLKDLAFAYESSEFWVNEQSDFTPIENYELLKAAIVQSKATQQAVKQANEAGTDENGQQEQEPILRYGATWGTILPAWQFAADQAAQPFEDLIAAHPPTQYAGDSYISSENLSPFYEMAGKIMARTATTAVSDWFNPKSYPKQIPESQLKRLPDIIELSL